MMNAEEKLVFELRELYEASGYRRYRMSKFEEYDLYARNKDLLVSEGMITFTDTNGKLMALKPDVTLSIIKNTRIQPGAVDRVYYNENVYRISESSRTYKEIMQTGLECMGAVDDECTLQVALLAAKSLKAVSEKCVLSVSYPQIAADFAKDTGLEGEALDEALSLISEKNLHGLSGLLSQQECGEQGTEKLMKLAVLSGSADKVLTTLEELGADSEKTAQLCYIKNGFDKAGLGSMLSFDLSAECGTRYYSGIVLKGYVEGVPSALLSGGRYDALMRRMGKKCGAVGFAVYMDLLERYRGISEAKAQDETLNIALPKGRLGEKVYAMFEKAGFGCPEVLSDSRKLIFTNAEKNVSYFWVKPSDVAVYVERGAADIGVCGKDILMEHEPDVYELLDLKTGKCRLAVAGKKDFADDTSRTLKVASKFANAAASYYTSLGRDIDIIQLNGSIELAPILGLSDVIVDIVETGTTLRENGLMELETIENISARLISNKASFEFKKDLINRLCAGLKEQVETK